MPKLLGGLLALLVILILLGLLKLNSSVVDWKFPRFIVPNARSRRWPVGVALRQASSASVPRRLTRDTWPSGSPLKQTQSATVFGKMWIFTNGFAVHYWMRVTQWLPCPWWVFGSSPKKLLIATLEETGTTPPNSFRRQPTPFSC